ncbi:MAG: NAD-dependent DNA ligase LigA [Saprospiraceae bacterium]|nr:NAD-dependent DNA ligase LigA [Saprospiraceae bacterium]MBP7680052.1 NAD-dependent DNA ligase LigA [Saprospiraceae bacterium]
MYNTAEQQYLVELTQNVLHNITPLSANEQVQQLRQLIRFHEWRYYILNDPSISDFDYDILYKKLQALETQHPHLVAPDSPTQRVSSDLTESFDLVRHLSPMLSLDNSYNADDLLDFDKQVKKLSDLTDDDDVVYCVEPKFDGGSIALLYENDTLVRAATRGNGEMGDDITNNIKTLKSVPLTAPFSRLNIHRAELRGEALIRKDIFLKINEQREVEDESPFANPRNAATGGLRTKDPTETANRGIEAFIYQIGFAESSDNTNALKQFGSHHATIEALQGLGFKVPGIEKKLCKNIREAIDFCLMWQEQRDTYDYEIDGMVVKADALKIQELCGYTSHHPRWAIAFKFKAKQAAAKLLHVEFQVGKIGSVTPVAKLEPVALAGVTVSSVSLHNEDFITARDIRIGDTVLVERAGDVIPYIVKPLVELRDGSELPIAFPTHCPVCHTALTKEEDEAAWRCNNYACPAQVLQRTIHHVSKDAMDIDGMGKSIIERFIALGWIQNIADIYNLDYNKIAQLEGFGEKSANNLRTAIDKAKHNPIHRLLHSLSIHHLGKKVSKLIAEQINNVQDLADWQLENYTAIKDVGPVVAQNVIAFFADASNQKLLAQLQANGVNFSQTDEDKPQAVVEGLPLSGNTILFTGTLTTMGRKEAELRAQQAGAKILGSVSSNLNILVVGTDAGSKLTKAQKLGTVQILTEQEFVALVGG